jgi:Ca-activated chloride channel family protein
MNEGDLKPNRLIRAKYKIRDLIHAAQNTQMGLVVFTEEAFTVSPLSQDANTLNVLLDELAPDMMPIAGSDSGLGLMEGYQLLKQAAQGQGNHLLLITASHPTANSWRAAKTIADGSFHLSVLAMLANNTANQALIANLQQLAKTGNGTFYLFTADTADIQRILATSSKQVIKNENKENAYLWLDAGPWFCLLLIPIALWVLRDKGDDKH